MHWFEDAEPVEPRELEDVREQATTDIAAGASLMVGPFIKVSTSRSGQMPTWTGAC